MSSVSSPPRPSLHPPPPPRSHPPPPPPPHRSHPSPPPPPHRLLPPPPPPHSHLPPAESDTIRLSSSHLPPLSPSSAPDKVIRRKKKDAPQQDQLHPPDKPKEKKPRKPRDPNKTTQPRKKQKTDAPHAPRQSTLTESLSAPVMSSTTPVPVHVPSHSHSPAPRPLSSGQNYDPIRGSTVQVTPAPHVTYTTDAATSAPPPASAFVPPPASSHLVLPHPDHRPDSNDTMLHRPPTHDTMDIDPPYRAPGIKATAPSKSPSSGPTPKDTSRSALAPPKATGSGLLSAGDLFGRPSSEDPVERKTIDIELHIPLNPNGINTVNIAQEIVRKYGHDAINPRAAAHRQQLLRIAAQQSSLEGGNTDDMSLDFSSDPEADSNPDGTGPDKDRSATDLAVVTAKPPVKRREEYDKDDDFIDDTELAWQEQAAVAKDGFFVYSGPLVAEGQRPVIEAYLPDSTTANTTGSAAAVSSSSSTRGTTRGRGRGARSRAVAPTASDKKDVAATGTTVRVRGTGTTRARGGSAAGASAAPRKRGGTKAVSEKARASPLPGAVAGPLGAGGGG